jgi:hypothetical protein
MRRTAVATSVSVVGALLAIAGPTFATPAGAAPISNPTLTPFAAPASITVPNGVCRVSTVVTSGFGGADTLSTHVLGGDGATISVTYRVRPGESLTFGIADGGSGGSAKGAGQRAHQKSGEDNLQCSFALKSIEEEGTGKTHNPRTESITRHQ